MAQLPPRGLWRTKAGVRNVLLSAWLGRDIDPPSSDGSDPVGQALARRYLAAFGPAAVADLRAWCGLAGLPAADAAIRQELVSFLDERGRVLLDLPDAPRPDPDTPTPVRFLSAFDNAVLGYDDRGRIIDDAHRGLSVAGARVVLVDGRVAATWTVEAGTVVVAPWLVFPGPTESLSPNRDRDWPCSRPTTTVTVSRYALPLSEKTPHGRPLRRRRPGTPRTACASM